MQAIALENNLSETAFFVATGNSYHIRWFTPLAEVELCGHATLASAHVIFNLLGDDRDSIIFESKSGPLHVTRKDDQLEMDFPVQQPAPCETPHALRQAFDKQLQTCLRGADYILVLHDEAGVADAAPDMSLLSTLDLRGVAITARSDSYDFVCRFFAPKYGINEDPVTGSAFTQLVPYWAQRLGKNEFSARQLSRRGGDVSCALAGDRVKIAGQATLYMEGTIRF
jgi:PhzF family phenazine biosynthesis protein